MKNLCRCSCRLLKSISGMAQPLQLPGMLTHSTPVGPPPLPPKAKEPVVPIVDMYEIDNALAMVKSELFLAEITPSENLRMFLQQIRKNCFFTNK